MELKKFKINNHEIEFVCESRYTRSGFAHDCTLFVDGRYTTKCTAHYLNRTWERYRYQSVMLGAVNTTIKSIESNNEQILKEAHGWKKMTPDRRKELEVFNGNSPEWQLFVELYNQVKER